MNKYFKLGLICLLVIAAAGMLWGCGDMVDRVNSEIIDEQNLSDPSEKPETPQSVIEEKNQDEEYEISDGEMLVTAAYADKSLLDNPDAHQLIIDEDAISSPEYQVEIAFCATEEVRRFEYFKVNPVEKDENIVFSIGDGICFSESFLPEKAIVIATEFAGSIPARGISYEDQNGNRHFYLVTQSGMDGDVVLSEFAPYN